jgi:transcriptional regulator with XRE-family HTH domain
MDENKKAIGARVRAARDRLELTRPQLAQKLDLDHETIKKYETGERVTQWVQLAKVAEALKTSPNELLGFPEVDPASLAEALKPILFHYDIPIGIADNIAGYLVRVIKLAQSVPEAGPPDLRYRLAAQLAISQFQEQKPSPPDAI